jgi:hypothetical protein
MGITQAQLKARIAQLTAERAQALAANNAASGVCEQLLASLIDKGKTKKNI